MIKYLNFAILAGVTMSVVWADCGLFPSDTTFLPDGVSAPVRLSDGSIADSGVLLTSSLTPVPPLASTATMTISRVVGPGTASEFDSNGFLVNWNTYVQNGVLSPHAWLDLGDMIQIDRCSNIGSTVGIYLNDHLVKNVPSTSLPMCVQIDTQYIKFAQRGAPGQPSTPAVNRIGATLDVSQSDISAINLTLNFGALNFKAMSPIILVHGIRADQTWFSTNGFNVPLDQAKVPYEIATKANFPSLDPGTITDTGITLNSRIPASASGFGATVTIVAHSKGGLWSRYFLKYGPVSTNVFGPPTPNNFGVLSLTTLDTPHDGSILADVLLGGVSTAYLLGVVSGSPSLVDSLVSSLVGSDIPRYPI